MAPQEEKDGIGPDGVSAGGRRRGGWDSFLCETGGMFVNRARRRPTVDVGETPWAGPKGGGQRWRSDCGWVLGDGRLHGRRGATGEMVTVGRGVIGLTRWGGGVLARDGVPGNGNKRGRWLHRWKTVGREGKMRNYGGEADGVGISPEMGATGEGLVACRRRSRMTRPGGVSQEWDLGTSSMPEEMRGSKG